MMVSRFSGLKETSPGRWLAAASPARFRSTAAETHQAVKQHLHDVVEASKPVAGAEGEILLLFIRLRLQLE